MSNLKNLLQKSGSDSNLKKLEKEFDFEEKNKWVTYSYQIAKRLLGAIADKKGIDKEFNQTHLAALLGVKRQRVNKIIKGKENLTLETIYNLSQAVGQDLISFPDYRYSKMKLGTGGYLSQKNIERKSIVIEINVFNKIMQETNAIYS